MSGTAPTQSRQPDLSIIVVHWNVPALLDGALLSIFREIEHCGASCEVLVVDNASSSPALHNVLQRYPHARALYLSENLGYAAGCNAGIRATSGECILLLNPDVEVLPGAFTVLLRTLRVASHIGIVAPVLLNVDRSIQSTGYRFPGITNVLCDLFPIPARLAASRWNGRVDRGDGVSPYTVDYPLGAAMLVARTALEAVGPLDESYGMYCEEIDWAKRFAANGYTQLIAPAARVVHLAGQSTGQRPLEMTAALWNSRALYYERWGSSAQRKVIGPLVARHFCRRAARADPRSAAVYAALATRFASLGSGKHR